MSCVHNYVFSLTRPGLRGVDTATLGIPSEEELISTYSALTGVAGLEKNWNFYLAFTFFRVAAILQGVYKRSLQRKLVVCTHTHTHTHTLSLTHTHTDQASADNAKSVGLMAERFADKGWEFAQAQDKWASQIFKPSGTRNYSTSAPQNSAPSISLITGPRSNFPPRLQKLYTEVGEFLTEEVLPIEEELFEHQRSDERWTPHRKMEELKVKPLKLASPRPQQCSY